MKHCNSNRINKLKKIKQNQSSDAYQLNNLAKEFLLEHNLKFVMFLFGKQSFQQFFYGFLRAPFFFSQLNFPLSSSSICRKVFMSFPSSCFHFFLLLHSTSRILGQSFLQIVVSFLPFVYKASRYAKRIFRFSRNFEVLRKVNS